MNSYEDLHRALVTYLYFRIPDTPIEELNEIAKRQIELVNDALAKYGDRIDEAIAEIKKRMGGDGK